jgi:non-ribosomal peptide synthetase component F
VGNLEETKITTLHGLFAEQAKKTPNQIAVIAGSEQLSYHELEVRASQLARLLQQRGVGPAAIVGIMLRRSVHILIAMLGILKAGAA